MYLLDSLCARTAILIFLLAYELRHSTDNVTHRASQDSFSFGCLIFLQYRYMPELRVLLRIMLIAEEHFVTIVFTQLPLVPRDANLPLLVVKNHSWLQQATDLSSWYITRDQGRVLSVVLL